MEAVHMKKLTLLLLSLVMTAGTVFAETDCDIWLGTWDVVKEDGSSCVWVIDEIVTGTSTNIPCQAIGTSTPSGGGESTPFQIITVSFFPGFIYTESKQLGEGQLSHELVVDDVGESFVSGTSITDYDIVSGTKRVSGPRCGGVDPRFITAGDNETVITVTGTETNFDNASSIVTIACPEIELLSTEVISATEIQALVSVAEDAADTSCSIAVTTGDEQILCSIEVRGAGDPSLVVWEFETGGLVSSSPAIAGGYVYFGSADSKVYCLDAQTGAKIWEYETGNVVLSSPAVTGGYVYIGSNDNKFYCLDAASGAKVWEFEADEQMQSSAAIVDGYVYVGGMDDKVYCLDAQTGAKIWEFTTEADVFSTPAVTGGYVYVGGVDFIMYCLDAKTGALVWQFATDGDIPPSPAVAGGKVFFGSKDNYFYCLDAATGQKLWDFQTGDIVFDSPAVYEDFVIFGSLDKSVYCLNTEDGSLAWEFQASGIVQSSPAVTDDYVYVGSSDKNVYCLDSRTGIKLWNFKTNDTVISSPSIYDGKVYVGSYDGSLYCLKASDDEEYDWPMFRNNLARTGTPDASACPIAAAVDNDPEVLNTARLFRDEILARSSVGKKIIDLFYRSGSSITDLLQRCPACKKACADVLNAAMPVVSAMIE